MPELPEVETIRKTLIEMVVNQKIEAVTVNWAKIIKEPDDHLIFSQLVKGETILDIHRKGKFLLFELTNYTLVSHLRMEGKYGVFEQDTPVTKHTHVIFHFESGKELRYQDVRKFGTMHLYPKGEEFLVKPLNQIGPDPFEEGYTFDKLYEKIHKSQRAIKNILLDQQVIAGLGNIYVDETLYKAQIHPLTKGAELNKAEIKRLLKHAKETLTEAVAQGGTTIRSYVNSQGQIGMFQQQLFAYGQENTPCKRCGEPIVKIKVAGRGTHLCTICQPIKE
ncbi:DNA-formamidopyrimidine glycosylase [Paraliobacillus sediminis]|uniref:DNA-formamidopyrimidine glycosylase n=1 Tax=Paraliobacillus sediminis TaxID=1885916 RepID=UPI000E3DB47C|nr:DNA-formamidopyrimidine glycosylase [Paraliobacillus sediminis]